MVGQRTAAYHLDCKSSISFFRIDRYSLCQLFRHLQHEASKWPYPAWLQNHSINPIDWSVYKSESRTTRIKNWIKEKISAPFWAGQSAIASPWISTQPKMSWVLLQRRIWLKNFREMHSLWCIFVPCKRKKLFCKTSFLADYKRYFLIVVFSSYSIVEVVMKQNKHAKLCIYVLQWNVLQAAARWCPVKKAFLEFQRICRKTPVLESFYLKKDFVRSFLKSTTIDVWQSLIYASCSDCCQRKRFWLLLSHQTLS